MSRVRNAAQKLNAETFEGKGIVQNRAWIQSKIKEGYKIYDIGPDFERRLTWRTEGIKDVSSMFYNMERMETKSYSIIKLYNRTGKFQGGSPLLGE